MLGNEMNDFDLQIRSMLEDAEVKPSRRVWKAVSSRIGAGSRPAAASWGWMGWAGACAAFAAIAVGVFIGLNHPGNRSGNGLNLSDAAGRYAAVMPAETSKPAEAAVAPETAEPAVVPERKSSAPAALSAVRHSVPSVTSDIDQEAASDAVPDADPGAGLAVAGSGSTTVKPAETSGAGSGKTAATPAESSVTDGDYLPIEWEDEDRGAVRRPLQVYAEGALLANESDIRMGRSWSYMSSGLSIARTGITELGDSSYGIPFSAGLGVRFYVLPCLAVGLGFDYSFLTRDFNGRYVNLPQNIDVTGTVSHTMQYVGIPVSLSYDFVAKNMFRFYGYGSAEAEYCFSNNYRVNASQVYDYSTAVQGLQWSVGAGVGVEFRFIDWLGIYLDPGIRYYFNCNHPTNIRTDKPLMVNFDLGVRFSF